MRHIRPSILTGVTAIMALAMTSCDAILEPSSTSTYPYNDYLIGSTYLPAPPPPAGPLYWGGGPLYWGNGPVAPGTNGPVNRPAGRPVTIPMNRPVTLPDHTPVDNPVTQPIVPSRPIGGSSEPGIVMPPSGSGLTGTPTRPGGRVPASNAGRM